MVETPVGCSVKTMLNNTLGMDDNYVEDRIKTIFLDAKPVDDINTACINDGSVLALSGAMPGLAGAPRPGVKKTASAKTSAARMRPTAAVRTALVDDRRMTASPPPTIAAAGTRAGSR